MPLRRCTYRLQLRPGFGYREVAAVAPYLRRLGVSHVYTSPYLQAGPGSTHGYDVVDHTRINGELGTEQEHEAMRAALAREGLLQLIDVVPNHMRIDRPESRWWWDVLENGPASRYASYFDVDWDPPEEKLRNTVLLPVLGDHYGRVLESGSFRVVRHDGTFRVTYGEQAFPLSPRSLDLILRGAGLDDLAEDAASLPPSHADDADSVRERHEQKERLASAIAQRCADPEVAARVDAALARLNDDHDALDALLSRQNYRLAYWRVAGRELDYRRFFDIAELAALRLEREHVFRDTHELVLSWARAGAIDGMRIDHPDGLRDPEQYFERLAAAAPGTWSLAEKILQPGEELPREWQIAGTTGYDWLNAACGLFVERTAEPVLTSLYAELTGDARSYEDVLYESKHDVLRTTLAADLERVVQFFVRVCEARRRYRDHTRHDLRLVLRETVACFPVYRSYVRAEAGIVRDADVRAVDRAIEAARARRPDLERELFDLLRDILLLRITGPNETGLVMRFQQLTAPVTAKGAEDTAFYRYTRFAALNEVGGEPGRFGTTLAEFHDHNARAAAHWPETLLATSTHDTKRSEDVRVRMAALSERADEWAARVRAWHERAARYRTADAPEAAAELLLWQTLVGAHPLDVHRATAYMEKAIREMKTRTSWIRQDERYEEGVRRFVLHVSEDAAIAREIAAVAARVIGPGRVASLALALLKLTSPGVPDIYQGTELWDLSLVDPDNRRTVDLARRSRLLEECERLDARGALARIEEGVTKQWLIARALALRARRAAAFAGGYEPICATGRDAEAVVAYARGGDVVAAAPVRTTRRDLDATVRLPAGRWRDVLSGGERDGGDAPVRELFAEFPVALLERT